LNLQLRGYHLDIKVFLIDQKDFTVINNIISKKKSNLVDLIDEGKIHLGSSFEEIGFPTMHDDTELQVTSYSSNDLYDEGYTFFRTHPKNLNKKESQIEFIIPKCEYVLVVSNYYYGCIFECDIEKIHYKNFDKNKFIIYQVDYPFINYSMIEKIKYSQNTLTMINRSKFDRIKAKTILYQPIHYEDSFIDSVSTFKKLFNPIQLSEKLFSNYSN
tara:strand:+ start:657 stop:1301 length:645 start_codon:yes stop_codon:yes gene_type:complete